MVKKVKTKQQKNKNLMPIPVVPSRAPQSRIVFPPPRFMRGGDVVPLRLKATRSLVNNFNGVATAGSANLSIAFTPINIASGGYTSLKQVFPLLNSMVASFTKFTMTRVVVSVRQTTPLTSGGYIAFCYEAAGPSEVAPPTSINDATTGQHSGVAVPGEVTTITFNCGDYENDWSETTDEPEKTDCGTLQLISENSAASAAVVGMITMEVDFFFCGYKAT